MSLLAAPAHTFAQCPVARVRPDLVLTQDSAALVFAGTILSLERAGATEIVTVDVERVWKGAVKERTTIYRPISQTGQDAESPSVFKQTRYLVIAHRLDATERRALGLDDRDDAFGTNTCGDGSRPIANTEPDLAVLGPGRGPLEPQVRVRNPKLITPIRTKVVAPVYPESARAAGPISGTALVQIWLDETGKVTRASILRSIPLLDQAAIDCVMQWEYLPALINGRPVPTTMSAAIAFAP